jgi:probable phosphoglycerate mutase
MLKKVLTLLLILSSAAAYSEETPAQSTAYNEPVTLWFVRHGKTLLNTLDRVQGWADSPLTHEGRRDTQYLGAGLKDIKFDAFYSSDAGRQRETMKLLLQQLGIKNDRLNELSGLREACFGSFEGGLNKDMAAAGARQLGLGDSSALFSRMKSGTLPVKDMMNALASADSTGMTENYQQVKLRTQEALHTIIDNAIANHQKNVLVISSGTAIQIMISDLTENPAKNKPLPNLAVIKMVYQNGKTEVTEIGNMQYLSAGKKSLQP